MNVLFTKYKHALMTGTALDLSTADLRVVQVLNAPDPATAEFLSDIPALDRLSTSLSLASVTVTDGVLDAADLTLPDPDGSPTAGVALVLYLHTGVDATARLIALIDTVDGLPNTLDGVDDVIHWDAQGIFAL